MRRASRAPHGLPLVLQMSPSAADRRRASPKLRGRPEEGEDASLPQVPVQARGRSHEARRLGAESIVYMRNLLGWLGTRLAQITLNLPLNSLSHQPASPPRRPLLLTATIAIAAVAAATAAAIVTTVTAVATIAAVATTA